MIDVEKNVAFWNRTALRTAENKAEFAGMLMAGREFEALYRCKAEQKHFANICPLAKHMTILEIGSGGGRWGFYFADKVASYTGLDISSEMIRISNEKRVKNRVDNINFICIDFLEFNPGVKYDVIYFSGVLQYMDDAIALASIVKARALLKENGVVISRDTIQSKCRIEKNGDYPVVYRLAMEYVDIFKKAHFLLEYSHVSYAKKRFTKIASRLYRLPVVTYSMAYIFREILCCIENVLGNPNYLKTKEMKNRPKEVNPQQHCFFKYVREK